MTKKTNEAITAFKGFDAELRCKGFQYAVGETYEHNGTVSICNSGFHACENPLDVWRYYGPFESRFAIVQVSGDLKRHADDSKIAAARIEIAAELSLPEFIKRAVDWVIDHCKAEADGEKVQASSGYYAQLASSGDSAQLASSGYSAQLASSGYYAQLASSGDSAQLASSGDSAQLASSGYSARLASSGYYARLASSGDSARLASSGDSARLASSGDSARLASSGDSARLEAKGKDSVIASSSRSARAKGAEGTWIALAEYDDDGKCIGFASGCVGRDDLKPDTYYVAKGGKLVEA